MGTVVDAQEQVGLKGQVFAAWTTDVLFSISLLAGDKVATIPVTYRNLCP